jgi:hypothetical protein
MENHDRPNGKTKGPSFEPISHLWRDQKVGNFEKLPFLATALCKRNTDAVFERCYK